MSFRILVIDDEPALCELVARMLRQAGYLVVTACNGLTGWELFGSAESFDLVITDSLMPGMGGHELVRRLRERSPTLPIVHLTGSLGSAVGLPSDVPTLLKPFDLPQLVPTVRNLLAA